MTDELFKRLISSIIILPIVIFSIYKGSFFFTALIFVCLTISLYEWHKMNKFFFYKIGGYILLVISFYCFYNLRIIFDEQSPITLIFILSICVLTDIGGFTFGKLFQGPKLTKLSPNKTYAGAVGGVMLSLLSVGLVYQYNLFNGVNFLNIISFVIFLSIISQCGDILISYFKRKANIKNTGSLIAGHGGILDRIDGMIFAIPSSYLILSKNLFNLTI
tara:strand:+ start:782 stop:1435 length:654 start_codon:yes stop_codon:yes gene_type:complete